MMLTAIQLREEDNSVLLTLPIGSPSSSQNFFIKSVEGLGPVKATISTSSWAGQDGGVFQNSRVPYRNIVLNVGIKPSYTNGKDPATLRNELYDFFAPKANVDLVILRNNEIRDTVRIKGYVESHEPEIFSNNMGAQISIICPDPYFIDYYAGTIQGTTGVPIDTSTFGSAPSGFLVDITFPRSVGSWYIDVFGFDRILVQGSYLLNDRLRLSTQSGNKFMLKTRSGVTSVDLNSLSEGSLNTTISARTKSFVLGFTSGGDPAPYTLFYTPSHVGV